MNPGGDRRQTVSINTDNLCRSIPTCIKNPSNTTSCCFQLFAGNSSSRNVFPVFSVLEENSEKVFLKSGICHIRTITLTSQLTSLHYTKVRSQYQRNITSHEHNFCSTAIFTQNWHMNNYTCANLHVLP